MKKITEFFIRNSKLTIILTLGLAIYGIMGIYKMNAETYPSVSLATATIITSYDGASAADIEVKITKVLEDEIRTVSGLKDVKSTSQSGLSSIVVRVDMDDSKVNVKETMAEIQKAIDRATGLPNDLRDPPKFTEIKSDEFPIIEIAIVGPNEKRERDIVADLLKEDLEDNKKVKSVRLVGHRARAFQIRLNQNKLDTHHIGADEVLNKIRQRNTNIPGGVLKKDSEQKLIRIEGKIKNKSDLENIVIRSNFSGSMVRLRDIANVEDGLEELEKGAIYNGRPATLLIVTKKAGADTIQLVDQVYKKLKFYQETYNEVQFSIYNNEGNKVKDRVDVLANNAVSGLVLVVIFLFVFLPGRIGIMASLSLPIAVFATMGIMPAWGMNLDTITILALVIALGMLVDNSVVISENYNRLRNNGLGPIAAAKQSIDELWLPITATACTTIAAFLPMLVTKGVMGEFIKWIPIIVTIALVFSLVESFFLLPMRLTLIDSNSPKKKKKSVDWFKKFEDKFEALMTKLINRRYFVSGGYIVLVFASFLMMFKANRFILFPAEQTEIYIARVEMPAGSNINQTNLFLQNLSQSINKDLGEKIKHIVARSGISQVGLNDPKTMEGDNVGMLTIYVSEDIKMNMPHNDFIKLLQKVPNTGAQLVSYEARVNGPPVGNPIEATFRSNDSSQLDSMIQLVTEKLAKYQGIFNLKVNEVIGDEEVFIDINYGLVAKLGLDVNTIGSTIRSIVSGKRVSKVTLNKKDVDLIVRMREDQRKEIDHLKNIRIMDNQGNLVPLGEFVEFKLSKGRPQIKRFNYKGAKTLTGDVEDTIITSIKANQILKSIFNENRKRFPTVSLVFGGAQESTNESMQSLAQALVLSLIGIFGLLVFLFKSYLRPLIIMTTIPLGLIGFSVAFFFHSRPISFMALIGIIGLGGIIVNSGIVLISFIDQLRDSTNMKMSEILAKASGMRLRAVLVTSLTTVSGLIPTAYGIGGSDSTLIPMTMAMAWGLTSGTILTLLWVPCAYAIIEDFLEWSASLFKSNRGEIIMTPQEAKVYVKNEH